MPIYIYIILYIYMIIYVYLPMTFGGCWRVICFYISTKIGVLGFGIKGKLLSDNKID